MSGSDGPGHSHSHGHGHSHGHSHGFEGSWDTWLQLPALRVILMAVGLVGLFTLVGIVALWPDGEGRREAIAEGARLGLVTDRVDATVESVAVGPCDYSTPDDPQDCVTLAFIFDEGAEAGSLIAFPEINLEFNSAAADLEVGEAVVLGYEPSTNSYFYADRDRANVLVWLVVIFVLVVVALGRLRGLLAVIAMAATVAVLVGFVAPSVLDGNDPLLVSVVAASAIAFVSLYLTHGFTPTTTVALAGTLASLVLTLGLAALFFALARFTGFATEEGLTLPLIADIQLSSLLLGGAVLGALGALGDVTVTLVATVAELRHRNPNLSVAELVASGIRVGREHIASTVNTLLLAYAGASMPLLLLFAASNLPLAEVANSELVAVEIVRTLCGSIGLVAAVPITTVMAAVLIGRGVPQDDDVGETGSPPPDRGADGTGGRATQPPVVSEEPVVPDPDPDPDPEPREPARRPTWDDFAPDDIDDL